MDETQIALTAAELKEAMDETWVEIQRIQVDLGDRNRTKVDGTRMGPEEFWAWRRRASDALRHKVEDYRALKGQLAAARRREFARRLGAEAEIEDPHDEGQLLRALFAVTRRVLAECRPILEAREQAAVDAVKVHLRVQAPGKDG